MEVPKRASSGVGTSGGGDLRNHVFAEEEKLRADQIYMVPNSGRIRLA